MKRVFYFIFAITFFLGLTACRQQEYDDVKEKTSTVIVNLPQVESRSNYTIDDIAAYDIKMYDQYDELYDSIIHHSGGPVEFNDIPLGSYIITIETFNYNDKIIGSGSSEMFEITGEEETTTVDITVILKKYFMISLDSNNDDPDSSLLYANSGESFTVPECGFTYENHIFKGWGKDPDSVVYRVGETITITEDIMLYAIWAENYARNLDSIPSGGTYKVANADDLMKISELSNEADTDCFENCTFIMTADIDISAQKDWVPIAKAPYVGCARGDTINEADREICGFQGIFDGYGHKLTVQKKPKKWYDFSGLINSNRGTIKNLIVESKDVTIPENPAGDGDVSYGFFCDTNYGTIKNCIATGSITVTTMLDVSGIVRTNKGIVENCVNQAAIKVMNSTSWGGIFASAVGITHSNGGTVVNCVNQGTITGSDSPYITSGDLNGIPFQIAQENKENAVIKNCYWDSSAKYDGTNRTSPLAYLTLNDNSYDVNDGTIEGCGSYDGSADLSSTTITAGTAADCETEQTLEYTGTILEALNAYVAAHPDNELVGWIISDDILTLDF